MPGSPKVRRDEDQCNPLIVILMGREAEHFFQGQDAHPSQEVMAGFPQPQD